MGHKFYFGRYRAAQYPIALNCLNIGPLAVAVHILHSFTRLSPVLIHPTPVPVRHQKHFFPKLNLKFEFHWHEAEMYS